MQLTIGQKVAYPNQGVCLVEEIKKRIVGESSLIGYILRVLGDNSTIFVPTDNAENVGIRPLISSQQCKKLVDALAADFEAADGDWKQRSREFNEKLHSGDIFEAADVFKKLTLLSYEKRLSFREQTMLDKSKFLVVSELSTAGKKGHITCEREVCHLVESACQKHRNSHPTAMAVTH
ncbi:MAG: CarD family transcriptional regulator [Acidobacteria bacterium]|nr:CarD family transcriptional regulator [Acidobacteriota bacterium]